MEGLDLLRDAADALAAVDPDALGDGELGDALVEWQRLESRLAAGRARLTAAFEARRAYAGDGAKSAAMWLARKTNTSPAEMRARTRLARRLGRMPATSAALAGGRISERHAEILAALAASTRPPVAATFPHAESKLVEYAETLGFDDFVTAVRYWEAVVDEDGVEDAAAGDHAARSVYLSRTWRGNWALNGRLDPVTGDVVHRELDRLERELFAADWAEARATWGDATTADHLRRTPAQRRADALAAMAERSAARATDATGGGDPRPLFVVHLGDESLKRLCELGSGTVIAPGQLVGHLGDADIERIVYDGPSRRVVDLGRRSRFFTGALRRAIQLRDRRCTDPGCTVAAEDCDIDHIVPWAKGGPTDQANGEAKCPHSNRHKADTLTGPPSTDAGSPPERTDAGTGSDDMGSPPEGTDADNEAGGVSVERWNRAGLTG